MNCPSAKHVSHPFSSAVDPTGQTPRVLLLLWSSDSLGGNCDSGGSAQVVVEPSGFLLK